MLTTKLKPEEQKEKVGGDMKSDGLSDEVNKTLKKTIGEMVDGTQPFFLSDEEADQRLADLKRGTKQLLESLDAKKKPSP